MKTTNVAGVDRAWAIAAGRALYEKVGDYSVTGLLKPVRQVELIKRHDAEITFDVLDQLDIMLGNAMHMLLADNEEKNVIKEQRFSIMVDVDGRNLELSLKPDYLRGEYNQAMGTFWHIKDFKTIGAAQAVLALDKGKAEWDIQLNVYRWALEKTGLFAKFGAMTIEAFVRDWSAMDAQIKADRGYPQSRVFTVQIEKRDNAWVENFVVTRIREFEKYKAVKTDEELLLCTPEERWERPSEWVVSKKGSNGRALPRSRCQTEAVAKQFQMARKDPNDCECVFRPGRNVRCERYCLAGKAGVCQQWNAMKAQLPKDTEDEG